MERLFSKMCPTICFCHELGRQRSSGCETTAALHQISTRIQWDQFWTLKYKKKPNLLLPVQATLGYARIFLGVVFFFILGFRTGPELVPLDSGRNSMQNRGSFASGAPSATQFVTNIIFWTPLEKKRKKVHPSNIGTLVEWMQAWVARMVAL